MRKIISFVLLTFIFCGLFAQSEIPIIGATKTIEAQVCRIDAGLKEKSKVNKVYIPPTGWQILTFKPIVISNSGASYAFSLTPSNFTYTSKPALYSKFIELLEFAAEKDMFQKYGGLINQMRNDFEKYSNKVVPVYSKITTTGTVGKNNQTASRTRGRLYLDLKITLVYMPDNEEQFLQSIDFLRELINTQS